MVDPTLGFSVAPWLTELLKTIQAEEDRRYTSPAGARGIFDQAKANWIATNVVNRETGLPITPFTVPVPQRIVFFATSNSEWSQRSEVDPGATLPVLPTPVKTQPSVVLGTGAAEDRAQLNQVLGMILAKLIAIEKRLP